MSRVSKSVGRECAAFSCLNPFYNFDGTPSGLHFFKFPQKNPEKRFWCESILCDNIMSQYSMTWQTWIKWVVSPLITPNIICTKFDVL